MGLTFGGLSDGLHTITQSVDPTKDASVARQSVDIGLRPRD